MQYTDILDAIALAVAIGLAVWAVSAIVYWWNHEDENGE